MARKSSKRAVGKTVGVEALLEQAAGKLAGCRALKRGVILVRVTGAGAEPADYWFDCAEKGARLVREAPRPEASPTIEIIGDARNISGVLTGQKNALKHFLAGGFRVRGDLRYFSDLALEMGILTNPL
jgi:hypothetical protein